MNLSFGYLVEKQLLLLQCLLAQDERKELVVGDVLHEGSDDVLGLLQRVVFNTVAKLLGRKLCKRASTTFPNDKTT